MLHFLLPISSLSPFYKFFSKWSFDCSPDFFKDFRISEDILYKYCTLIFDATRIKCAFLFIIHGNYESFLNYRIDTWKIFAFGFTPTSMKDHIFQFPG